MKYVVLIKRRTKCVITLNLFPVLEMLVNVLDSSLAVGQQYIKTAAAVAAAAAAAAKSLQSCPTLCDPIVGSPPGSSVHGIFQARVLEWGAIAFSDIKTRYQVFQQVFSYLFNSGVIYWGNDLEN